MRKLNSLLAIHAVNTHSSSELSTLAKQVNAHLNLQQFWEAIAPQIISQSSFAGSLNNGQLTIYAYNATVAAKIKLTSAMLLTQLQNLAISDPFYREYKVTAIRVKVQVKSRPKLSVKVPRKLSQHAANSLQHLAEQLGSSTLADKLIKLANKA